VFRLRLGLLRRILQSSCISNGVRVDLPSASACVISAGVLALAALAAAQPDASAAPIPVAVAAPDDLAQLWIEAVRLERASWDLDDSEGDQSYELAIEAVRRFEAVSEWLGTRATPDVEPYRHAYWRTARSQWLAAESLELAERDRRREHLSRAIEFTDLGLAADPDCAQCMLWKFNAMGRRQQIEGLYSGARNVKTMARLLDRAIELNPDFREGERSSTLGNLHYVSAIFYRVLPDWFWLKWIVGVRGDKQRALEHARNAVGLHESRIDFRVEVGAQLSCMGASKKDPERLAEGHQALLEATAMRARNFDDRREIAAAHVMINKPKKACSYAGAEWVEIGEDGAIASTQ
jgi:tetratricopeptide (TPR) repeat protein